jgi:molybdate transport system substrate-binding protein
MKKLKNKHYSFLVLCACLFLHHPLLAEERLTIGVAANFMLPFQEISLAFENKHDIKINATYTSTGNLYGQIIHGAPYDLFLAADERRPERLLKEGLISDTFIYARGKTVLWTAKKQLCAAKDWQEALMMQGINKISIANPEIAPYGAAAIKALESTGRMEAVRKKLVFAQNVVQAFQYAHTESVDAGFCALSSVFSEQGKMGCYFLLEHAPVIIQRGCVLKGSKNRKLAEQFATFLCSREAQNIKTTFGYN